MKDIKFFLFKRNLSKKNDTTQTIERYIHD